MKLWRLTLILSVNAVRLLAQSHGGLPQDRVQEIEKLITHEMSRQKIPMVTVAVALQGELRWSNGYGYADLENLVPAKAATVHRLGSSAKPITAVATLQLWEAGKLDLDAPVQKYVPEFPEKQAAVTARLLLCHQGGIRHYQNLEEVGSTRHYTALIPALQIFAKDPLVAQPGTKYSYSTYGYNLLGAAVERAAGLRFVDYLQQALFRAAGMTATRDDDTLAIIPNRARGYARAESGELRNCDLADTSNKIPGGGLLSTAPDLIRFALAVRNGKLLKRDTVELMFTSQKTKTGEPTPYGLGWMIRDLDGSRLVLHGGGQQGTSTLLAMLPREGIAVALLCNLERAEPAPIANSILRLLKQ